MANRKTGERKALIRHCLIYGGALLTATLWFGNIWQILLFTLLTAALHALIDFGRVLWERRISGKYAFCLFLLDQFLHVLTLAAVAALMPVRNALGAWLSAAVYNGLHVPLFVALPVVLAYVICLNPAGILIKKAFQRLGYQEPDTADKAAGAAIKQVFWRLGSQKGKAQDDTVSGYVIGQVERVIILTLTLLGQFTAISFVVAAKSLARIKQLEDRGFAEKYLVGTLSSFAIAMLLGIGVNLILKGMGK